MGDLPLMTETGTFDQRRGTCYGRPVGSFPASTTESDMIRSVRSLFTCTVIPNRGAWLEYETDSNDVFYVRVDKTRKVPVAVLIRALGIGARWRDSRLLRWSEDLDRGELYQGHCWILRRVC